MTASHPAPSAVSLALIDDHDAIHAAIEVWCAQADPPINLVGSYFSLGSFIDARPFSPLHAGVVVFDLELQSRRLDIDGLAHLTGAGYRVIVYSHLAADEIILTCLEFGAATYLVKSEGKSHLVEAIRAALTDSAYVGPRMASAMYNDQTVGRPNLAAREKEVLIAWFQTDSKQLVAERLFVSTSTVRTHLQRARTKYAQVGRPAATKAALVARAIQDGIINVDDL
jgi:DNA-binding NarL/FixJ family response regulator